MIDGFLIIILVMLGCIGLGVLLGWVLWGTEMKYYKNKYDKCVQKHRNPATEIDSEKLEMANKNIRNALSKSRVERHLAEQSASKIKLTI
jgi:hypothetical protein